MPYVARRVSAEKLKGIPLLMKHQNKGSGGIPALPLGGEKNELKSFFPQYDIRIFLMLFLSPNS